jgi:Domain of unknown function (DUF1707)
VTDNPELRAGDADRDRVAEQLREHFAAGRLTPEEFQERLEATYAARTFGDLSPVLADLPAAQSKAAPSAPYPGTAQSERSPVRHRSGQEKALRAVWTAWAMAVSINLVIWVLVSLSAGELVYFWPMWVAGPWGAVLIASTIAARLGRD